MNEEILKRFDVLTEKLGLASGHVYQAFVAQAHIKAIESTLWLVAAAISIPLLFKWLKRITNSDEESAEFFGPIASILLGIMVLFAIIAAGSLPDELNGDYWATKQIIELIKK